MIRQIQERCFMLVLVAVLALLDIADVFADQSPICGYRNAAEHLIATLPEKDARLHGLEKFRKMLEHEVINRRTADHSSCIMGSTYGASAFHPNGEDGSSSRGRRLQAETSTLKAVQDAKEFFGPAAAVSMDFIYRSGPIVQAFAGMGVTGPSVDGGNPNYTFMGAPVSISSNEATGNMLLGDEVQHKVQELVRLYPGWNTTTVVDGAGWTNITDAGRVIEITMRTPSAVTYDGNDVYFTDYDNSRIFVRSGNTSQIAVVANLYGTAGMSGDCGPATLARLRMPLGLAVIPPHGTFPRRLAFSDSGNNRVRTIELTTWPFCVNSTGDCSVDAGNAIDSTTGLACTSGDCGFNVSSPDECAFRCKQFGVTTYPIPAPFYDVALSNADIVKLMIGCGSGSGDPNAYLLACSSDPGKASQKEIENAVPFYIRTLALVKDFVGINATIANTSKIQGAVVGGRLLRLNGSSVQSSDWGVGNSGTFRISNHAPLACHRWGWIETDTENSTALQRAGKCFLFNSSTQCTGSSTTGPVSVQGTSDCAPGKVITLIGGGDPGLAAEPTASGQHYISHPLQTVLAKPQGLLVVNGGMHGEMLQSDIPAMTLVVSDTAHNRILAYPLITHRNLKVRFWLFLSGPKAEYTTYAMWKQKGYDQWVVYWALGQAIGWHNDFNLVRVSDLTVDQKNTPEKAGRRGVIPPVPEDIPADCDPTLTPVKDKDQSSKFTELGVSFCAVKVCPVSNSSVWQASGFTSQGCCQAFCEKTYESCGIKIGLWASSISSLQKCNALNKIKSCFYALSVASGAPTCSGGVSGQSVTNASYINHIVGAPDGYDVAVLEQGLCQNITSGVVNSTGCGGWCDTQIADVLGVHRHWHSDGNDSATSPIYGVLVEIPTFSYQQWHVFGNDLQMMKDAEIATQLADGDNYTKSISDPIAKFGAGQRALFQMTLDYALETAYSFSKDSVRASISTVNWYESSSKDDFMTEGTDRNTLVYWLSGFLGKGKAVGAATLTQYHYPTGLMIDKAQRLYISDSNNYRILMMQNLWTNEFTVPIIGTGYKAFNGDGEFATQTAMMYPRGLAMDSVGVLHFSDPAAHSIRQLLGENWNLPCGWTQHYWNLLTNTDPSSRSADIAQIYRQINCRISQVKATLLNQIEVCQTCLKTPSQCATQYDMRISLCAKEMWQVRPLATTLMELLMEPPDCTGCARVWGCQLETATLSWNLTNDTGSSLPVVENQIPGTNETFQMTWWLSDAAIQAGIDALRSLQTDASSNIDWASSSLPSALNQALHTVGSSDLNLKIQAVKTALLGKSGSSAMKMAYYQMWHWYQNIVDVCIHVVDNKEIDRRAIIGAQYYNKKSEIAARTFWASLNTTDGVWSASTVYPRCDFQHPRMFGYEPWMSITFDNRMPSSTSQAGDIGPAAMLHKESIQHRCCNVNSYICGEGEGPCSLNVDCGAGLICGKANCLWDKTENCCMAIDASHSFARIQEFSNKVGYRNLEIS